MSLPVTIVLAILALGLTVFAGWRGARPPNLVKGPRLMPWRAIMLLAAAFFLFLLIHLTAMMGFLKT